MKLRRFISGLFFKVIWFGLLFLFLLRAAPKLKELNPVYLFQGVSTSLELMQIGQALDGYYANSDAYPAEFSKFLGERFQSKLKDVRRDSWDTPYRFFQVDRGYIVCSAGPDRMFATEDDYYLSQGLSENADLLRLVRNMLEED